jgi:hypothetical protein
MSLVFVYCFVSRPEMRSRGDSEATRDVVRTGSQLGLVCKVVLVEVLRLLLGLLVVDGVGTGWCHQMSA